MISFDICTDWYYFAILSLAESGKAKAEHTWIAKRLNLTKFQAQSALQRLKRLKLLEVKNGYLFPTRKSVRVPSDIPSAAARRLQHDHLQLAQVSLEKHSIEKRDMTSMTMLAAEDRIPGAKEMIKKFRRRLSRYLEGGTGKKRVYVAAVQLFPVSEENVE